MSKKKDSKVLNLISSSRCRCCRSRHRSEIDKKLLDGESYTDISKWLLAEHGEDISYKCVSRHHKNHVQKLITKEALDRYETEIEDTVGELEFLDFLRQACYDAIIEGRTEVSAYEAMKATQVKLKYTQEQPGLQELIDALNNIAGKSDGRLEQREAPAIESDESSSGASTEETKEKVSAS